MPLAALAVVGGLALGRSVSDKKAKKQEDKASQRGLPATPEFHRKDVNNQSKELEQHLENIRYSNNSLAISKPEHAASLEYIAELDSPTATARTSYEGLSSPYTDGQTEPLKFSAYAFSDAGRRTPVSSEHENMSLSSGSTSIDTPGVRVRTKGNDLKSGFPYHPRLYDLQVRPDDWQRFSDQVTDATRFSSSDYTKMWAAAGSVALTGGVLTTAWVGRTVNRSIQEKKVTTGLIDTSQGSLGGVLEQWNQSYFAPLGLHARLELSDSAMRKSKKKSTVIRRPSLTYSSREEREWKNEDRKFVVVVAELVSDETRAHTYELATDIDRAEMPVPSDPRALVTELPGDSNFRLAELPNNEDMAKEGSTDVVCAMAELQADVPVELPAGHADEQKLGARTDPV